VGVGVPFRLGVAGFPSNTVAWAEAYLRTKWHVDPCSRLATIDVGENWGSPSLFGEAVAWFLSKTKSPGLEAYLHTNWHLGASRRLATI